ncbi:glycosyltransferase family 4 protein [Microbacterium sp. X-17]|uniref:glycosyltransferase family 4 protein n=1 Tax=Microbacterium sp. X-17 TaxID=3144404 RepID=UPI0031F5ACE6
MSRPVSRVTVLGLNYPPEPTGISPYTGALSRGLARRGFSVRVLTTHPHYPEWRVRAGYGQWSRREQIDGVAVERMRHYVPARPTGVRRLVSEISFGTRLVFSRWGQSGAVVAISPALISTTMAAIRARLFHRDRPLVVWVQDLYTLGLAETGQGGRLVGRMMGKLEGWLLRRAHHVVVIHERFADVVSRDFDIPSERVVVVRNWTHLPPFPDVNVDAARHSFGWGGHRVVLHAGNMGVKQGLDNVVEAARLAAERGDAVRFVLLGDGGERERLEALGAGIPTLQFMRPLADEDFAKALAAADMLLVNEKPGVAEMAVPSKLTSYFSAGRPVVAATDATGITAAEIARAEAGVIAPAGDPAALLAAVAELASDPVRAQQLGENGRRYRMTVLDETNALDAFATLLTRLTADR